MNSGLIIWMEGEHYYLIKIEYGNISLHFYIRYLVYIKLSEFEAIH